MTYTQNDLDDMNIEEMKNMLYDTMLELGVATGDELELVTGVSGWNLKTLEDTLYYKTGSYELSHLLEDFDMMEEED